MCYAVSIVKLAILVIKREHLDGSAVGNQK